MSTQSEIIKLLEENRGKNISGTFLAEKLGVSRTTVWKTIKSLQDNGYKINAATNKGYCLSEKSDILSVEGILLNLQGDAQKWNDKIKIYETVDSTNNKAREFAISNPKQDCIFIADKQTSGKGRMGRSFYSPAKTGLYMSILYHKSQPLDNSLLITAAAAVAVVESIKNIFNIKSKIKWVNDIYIDDKKVCGILTEGAFNMESSRLDYIIIGIGINVSTQTFPEGISEIAAPIISKKNSANVLRNILAAEIIKNLDFLLEEELKAEIFMDRYRDLSFITGKKINIISGDKVEPATAIAIDNKAQLVVLDQYNRQRVINSGEVSIRLQ